MPFLARWKGMKEKGFHSFIERKKNLGPSEPEGGGGTCPPDFGSFTSVCSNGLYADISNQQQMQPYKSFL